jgi:hypothetical protein
MSPLSEIMKRVAIATTKGAGVTLASTTASLYIACQIEIKAHQVIYHYFPEKYVTVEQANGLTQEQLEVSHELMTRHETFVEEPQPLILSSQTDTTILESSSSSSSPPPSPLIKHKFWKEEANSLPWLRPDFIMASQEIIACSMEG